MTPQKYKFDNSVVFYAATIQQIKSFLIKNGSNKLKQNQININNLVTAANVNELIDFNLVKLVQNKHVLEDMIPFAANANINLNCRFLARIPSHSGDRRSKQMFLTNHYFCCYNFCKIKAAQLDPEYAILESCFPCGSFVKRFYQELNKNV